MKVLWLLLALPVAVPLLLIGAPILFTIIVLGASTSEVSPQ